MPDSTERSPDESYASIVRDGQQTLILIMSWDRKKRLYWIHEEGSDEILDASRYRWTAERLADMYLDGFREGYDRGYAACETNGTEGYAGIPSRKHRNVHPFWSRTVPSDGRDRDDVQGTSEADRPGG